MRKLSFLLILILALGLVASDMEKDAVMFGSIFSTALNASGKIPFKVSPFVVDGYGVFYFVQSPQRRRMRERMARRWREMSPEKRMAAAKKMQERVEKMKEMRKEIAARIREGIKKGIMAASRYGDVLKSVPDNYWLVFVFQSPRSIGSVSYPCMVVKVRMKDVRLFSKGKISEEEFLGRIILPPVPKPQETPPTTK